MAGVQALFFGDFLLCQQKKVTRLSGRNPDGLPARQSVPAKAGPDAPPGQQAQYNVRSATGGGAQWYSQVSVSGCPSQLRYSRNSIGSVDAVGTTSNKAR